MKDPSRRPPADRFPTLSQACVAAGLYGLKLRRAPYREAFETRSAKGKGRATAYEQMARQLAAFGKARVSPRAAARNTAAVDEIARLTWRAHAGN
jgi:hypothetical protein